MEKCKLSNPSITYRRKSKGCTNELRPKVWECNLYSKPMDEVLYSGNLTRGF